MDDGRLYPPRVEMNGRLLRSKKETAAMLGISVRLLEILMTMREIIPRRIGKRVLFDAREIERFARRDHKTKPERKGNNDAGQSPRV
jgi:hypothetical protein